MTTPTDGTTPVRPAHGAETLWDPSGLFVAPRRHTERSRGSYAYSPTGKLWPLDEKRREEVLAWLGAHGITKLIPIDDGALVVEPLNEGELLATWHEFQFEMRKDPITGLVRQQLKSRFGPRGGVSKFVTKKCQATVTDPPPGFRLPVWDAFQYVQHEGPWEAAADG